MANSDFELQEETLNIYVILRGKVKEQFLDIKDETGLTNNTEIMRLLIGEYYKTITATTEE